MKKKLYILCAAALSFLGAKAQISTSNCYFEIDPVTVDVNATSKSGNIKIINPSDRYVIAYQFDLIVPSGLVVQRIAMIGSRYPTYVDYEYNEEKDEDIPVTKKYHTLKSEKLKVLDDGSQLWRVLCKSEEDPATGNNRLSNIQEDVLRVTYGVSTPGVYTPAIRKESSVGNSTVEINACDQDGKVEYLKASSTSSVVNVMNGNVQGAYTYTMGIDWGTLCLPMDVTEVETVSGNGVKFYTLDYEDGELKATSAQNGDVLIPANKPVLAYAEGGGEYILKGTPVKVSDNLTNGVLTATYKTLRVNAAEKPAANFVLQKHDENIGFYTIGSTTATLGPCRGYVHLEDASAVSGVALSKELLIDGGLEDVIASLATDQKGSGAMYTIDGRAVAGARAKGVYITNGKKIFVR